MKKIREFSRISKLWVTNSRSRHPYDYVEKPAMSYELCARRLSLVTNECHWRPSVSDHAEQANIKERCVIALVDCSQISNLCCCCRRRLRQSAVLQTDRAYRRYGSILVPRQQSHLEQLSRDDRRSSRHREDIGRSRRARQARSERVQRTNAQHVVAGEVFLITDRCGESRVAI